MPTIYDVAKQAGVGVGTVSRVLNLSPHVRPETRARVLAAMRELDYQPHAAARSLASRRNNTFGVLVPFFTQHFFVEVLRGIQEEAYTCGKDMFLYNVQKRAQKEAYLQRIPREKRVDGLIIITLRVPAEAARRFRRSRFPVVLVDSFAEGLPSLVVDNEDGARQAVAHLLSLGHRRIAFLNGLQRYHASRERLAGYRAALAAAGIPLREELCREGEFTRKDGFAAMQSLWESGERPTAVFAASDLQAVGAWEFLRQKGVRVPEDIALVGYDDLEIAELLDLTTVRQPMAAMGRRALDWLLTLIEAKEGEGRGREDSLCVVLQPELVVRRSSGMG